MDKAAMIGSIVQKYNVKLDPDDPAFVLVELNKVVLESSAKSIIDKVQLAVKDMHSSGESISEDLQDIGKAVTNLENSLVGTMDQLTFLINELKIARSTPLKQIQALPEKPPTKQVTFFLYFLGFSFLSTILTIGGVYYVNNMNTAMLEEARLGRAINKALPYIDSKTKQNLQAAMQKTSQ